MIYTHRQALSGTLQNQSRQFSTLKVFKNAGSGENDLMKFMTEVKPNIDKLVCENVTQTGRKVARSTNRAFQAD